MPAKFLDIKNSEIVLFIIPAKKYLDKNIELFKHYVNKLKYECVYITVNKPYTTLMNVFQENKINSDSVFIIDGITPLSSGIKKVGNAVFLGSPRALTHISIAAGAVMEKLDKNKSFLFLDSLSTLCLYNNTLNVTRFLHFLINQMHKFGTLGIILSVESEMDKGMIAELSQFCDRVIELK
jgi:archaellum biogenesis ATPase FlaH